MNSVDRPTYQHHWLQRFSVKGNRVGEPLDLDAIVGAELKGVNWEGLSWFEPGKSLVMVHESHPEPIPTGYVLQLPDQRPAAEDSDRCVSPGPSARLPQGLPRKQSLLEALQVGKPTALGAVDPFDGSTRRCSPARQPSVFPRGQLTAAVGLLCRIRSARGSPHRSEASRAALHDGRDGAQCRGREARGAGWPKDQGDGVGERGSVRRQSERAASVLRPIAAGAGAS